MYQPPIPVNKDKQCKDCKQYENVGCWISICLIGQGLGEFKVVLVAGTCENWERRINELNNTKTSL